VFLFLIGFPSAMVGLAASMVGLRRVNGLDEPRDGLVGSLLCSLGVLAGLTLALLGILPVGIFS
jgi:hypothetical protein